MRKQIIPVLTVLLILAFSSSAFAHFGMLIPENSIISPKKKNAELQLSFSHPFELIGMNLVKPQKFSVFYEGKETDLLPTLKENKVMAHDSFKTEYKFKRPGMYTFFMEPTPYPEPAEDNYIIHYTKTVVSAFDEGEDWNKPLGVKTEIVPLTRPWGSKEYEKVIESFNNLPLDYTTNAKAIIMYSCALMETENYPLALNVLETANTQNRALVKADVTWYKALCYLKTNEYERALGELKILSLTSKKYSKDADAIIKKLNRKLKY